MIPKSINSFVDIFDHTLIASFNLTYIILQNYWVFREDRRSFHCLQMQTNDALRRFFLSLKDSPNIFNRNKLAMFTVFCFSPHLTSHRLYFQFRLLMDRNSDHRKSVCSCWEQTLMMRGVKPKLYLKYSLSEFWIFNITSASHSSFWCSMPYRTVVCSILI